MNPLFKRLDSKTFLKEHHQKLITDFSRAHVKLSNILASDNDSIEIIKESQPYKIDLQIEDVQYLQFIIDREANPKGLVVFKLKKAYGNAIIYLHDYTKRPSEKS